MTDESFKILIPIALFATIGFIVFYTLKYNYETKKAILERGGDAVLSRKKFPFFELGMLMLGVGVGLGLAAIPVSMDIPDDTKGLLVSAFIISTGGAGLISGFFIRRRLHERK